MPGASVRITNTQTNVETAVETTSAGVYRAPYLPPGPYRFVVSSTGFKSLVRENVNLSVAQTLTLDFALEIGDVTEQVTVSAESPLLQTDRTSVSGAVGAEMIEALPNITQNPLAYAFLQAGAVPRAAAN